MAARLTKEEIATVALSILRVITDDPWYDGLFVLVDETNSTHKATFRRMDAEAWAGWRMREYEGKDLLFEVESAIGASNLIKQAVRLGCTRVSVHDPNEDPEA